MSDTRKKSIRKQQVKDGYFDGRFRHKVYTDRKKEKARKQCRKPVNRDD